MFQFTFVKGQKVIFTERAKAVIDIADEEEHLIIEIQTVPDKYITSMEYKGVGPSTYRQRRLSDSVGHRQRIIIESKGRFSGGWLSPAQPWIFQLFQEIYQRCLKIKSIFVRKCNALKTTRTSREQFVVRSFF